MAKFRKVKFEDSDLENELEEEAKTIIQMS